MQILPIILGVAALGAGYFLFFTKEGKELIASFTNGSTDDRKKWDDPFKYLTPETAGAWNPKSKMYQDIQKRIGKNYSTVDDYYYE